jgi:hypothetical protein
MFSLKRLCGLVIVMCFLACSLLDSKFCDHDQIFRICADLVVLTGKKIDF